MPLLWAVLIYTGCMLYVAAFMIGGFKLGASAKGTPRLAVALLIISLSCWPLSYFARGLSAVVLEFAVFLPSVILLFGVSMKLIDKKMSVKK